MRNFLIILILGFCIYSCSSTRKGADTTTDDKSISQNDTVRIANDSLEYEIIIIDPGYSYFLNAIAKPEGYYTLSYLENKNQFLVNDYNQRVRQPMRYDPEIYTQEINYEPGTDYGYEVNYKLYNYFAYLAYEHGQRFSVPVRW